VRCNSRVHLLDPGSPGKILARSIQIWFQYFCPFLPILNIFWRQEINQVHAGGICQTWLVLPILDIFSRQKLIQVHAKWICQTRVDRSLGETVRRWIQVLSSWQPTTEPVSGNFDYFLETRNNSGACWLNLPDLGSSGEIVARWIQVLFKYIYLFLPIMNNLGAGGEEIEVACWTRPSNGRNFNMGHVCQGLNKLEQTLSRTSLPYPHWS